MAKFWSCFFITLPGVGSMSALLIMESRQSTYAKAAQCHGARVTYFGWRTTKKRNSLAEDHLVSLSFAWYGSNTKEYLLFQRVQLHARHRARKKKERWSIQWFKFKGWERKETLLSIPINTFSIIAFKLGSSDRATQNRAHNGHAIPLTRILKTYKPSSLDYPGREVTGIWGYRVCSLSSRLIKGNR